MMKTLKQTSAALMLALAVLASGCAADEEMTTATPTDGEDGELMTITVSAGSDADTRVAYDDSKVSSTDNDALTWETDDKIAVVGWDASYTYKGQEKYTLVNGVGKTTGSFTGKAIPGATQYYIVYLNGAIQVTSIGGIAYSPKTQIQAGDGNTSHLKDNLYLTLPTYVADLSNIQLNMRSAIMKFDLSNVPAGVGTLKKLTWMTETAYGNRSMELEFSQKEREQVTFSSSKQTLTAYLVFSYFDIDMAVKAGGKFTVTLEGNKTYYAERTVTNGKSYEVGKRYTATIDGTASTMEWQEKVEPVVVSTTVPGSNNYYNGLKMQIGTWETGGSDTQILLGEATIADGKASIPVDLSTYSDKPIWVCIPKVAKFFHTLTQDEVDAKRLTLPDKDGGSSLKAGLAAGGKLHTNEWIVALYMGVNQGGATGADATPIYWATGNLIATKTNSTGSTSAVFHIATAEETVKEASTTSTYSAPEGIAADLSSDSYTACALGAQWNKFGWGDITGLKVGANNNEYGPSITTGSISGNATYDIARAKLGGSWRLPTGGDMNTDNELAAFADDSFSGLSPDGMDWTESGYTGRTYTYTATNNITNTLKFPAAGYRNAVDVSNLGTKGFYWSGTVYDSSNGFEFHFSQSEAKRGYTPRNYGFSVRPVTE